MSIEKYRLDEAALKAEYELKLHELRRNYVEQNKKYNIGDYIYDITGIIKINSVGYKAFNHNIEIIYYGYKYKKIKGVVSRTKDKKISYLRETYDLRKIEI